MKPLIIASLLLLGLLSTQAQETKKTFEVKIHGNIAVSTHYDSRQSVAARNGQIYLWPRAAEWDEAGQDINAQGRFDIDAALSRFSIAISGPEIFGARSSALIETDFLGNTGSKDMGLRLRHAFLKLDWEKSSLLAGQSWHPLFITENFPATVNPGAGSPFHPLNRQPQLRYTYKPTQAISLLVYALAQNDFGDIGMHDALERSLSPELAVQLRYKTKNNFFAAFTAGYKSLRPLAIDPNTQQLTKELAQANYMALSLHKYFHPISIKTEAIYGGAMSNLVMIGGFAERMNDSPEREYIPSQTLSLWTDIHSNGKKIQTGVFVAYSKNRGTKQEAIAIEGMSRGGNIAHIYAITPRVVYFAHSKVSIGLEWMYSTAAYGSTFDNYLRPQELTDYTNNRITLCTRYLF